ncbi:MAG TPA: phosphoserine phosphatase [Ruminococcus sp.]|nr:phosphoserine phosphatase [Ruminococcus sp.]
MSERPIVAIMYDFDKTLCTKDMQDYSFIPSLGMTESEFWSFANELGTNEHMDSVLAYMYAMVKMSKDKNIPILRQKLVDMGRNVELFSGVESWFERISDFGSEQGVQVEHYVISSGMKEIIEGTSISKYFKSIFACEFLYDENGNGIWPKTDVNYTNKTQFVYRINKGVLDVANDNDLNRSMPDDSKRVPFCNMIYIGDGLSDVPCMKMMKAYGGYSIAVYQSRDSKVEDLLKNDRVDYIYPADYSAGTGLDTTVRNIIRKMAICDILFNEKCVQKSNLTDKRVK